jgi:hypothetical protein
MSFIQDYLTYNKGNECPRSFHLWSAFAVLSAVVGRKVHIDLGYFVVHPNLYICLVGDQGSRKSTAKDIARDLVVETFPDIPVAASVMTREAITKFLGSAESMRSYKEPSGAIIEWHPYVLFINELKNFLSVNPGGMIDFLTDIYDRKYFDVGTKNKGTDLITNPCFTILACETPGWISRKLKEDIISGGFSRRMIFIYETEESIRIPFPTITPESAEAWKRVQAHLRMVNDIIGPFVWTDDARTFYDKWYRSMKSPDDENMKGYYRSKHIQLLKICMLLALAEPQPKLILTHDLLVLGLAHLDSIEPNMPKLSAAAGRNELAIPMQRVLQLIAERGGFIPEKVLQRDTSNHMNPMEQSMVLRFLKDTDQIFYVTAEDANKVRRNFICNKDGALKLKKAAASSPAAASTPPVTIATTTSATPSVP